MGGGGGGGGHMGAGPAHLLATPSIQEAYLGALGDAIGVGDGPLSQMGPFPLPKPHLHPPKTFVMRLPCYKSLGNEWAFQMFRAAFFKEERT